MRRHHYDTEKHEFHLISAAPSTAGVAVNDLPVGELGISLLVRRVRCILVEHIAGHTALDQACEEGSKRHRLIRLSARLRCAVAAADRRRLFGEAAHNFRHV